MKLLLTFLVFIVCLSYSRAQETDVVTLPVIVTDLFTLRYPDARSIDWQYTGDQYKAEFKNNKMTAMALLDAEGRFLQTRTQIKTIALPEPALDFLTQNFVDEKIDLATISEDEKGVITFSAVIDKTDFTFDASGQLLDTHSVVLHSPEKAE